MSGAKAHVGCLLMECISMSVVYVFPHLYSFSRLFISFPVSKIFFMDTACCFMCRALFVGEKASQQIMQPGPVASQKAAEGTFDPAVILNEETDP